MSVKNLLLICLLVSISFNCSEPKQSSSNSESLSAQSDANPNAFSPDTEESSNKMSTKSDTIFIEVNQDIKFNWNNSTSKIIEDRHWINSKKAYEKNKLELIKIISNKEKTNAQICQVEGPITKGQMAFIVLNELEVIPYAQVFESQYCVIYPDCPYIGGLINSINNPKASNQLMEYLYPSDD